MSQIIFSLLMTFAAPAAHAQSLCDRALSLLSEALVAKPADPFAKIISRARRRYWSGNCQHNVACLIEKNQWPNDARVLVLYPNEPFELLQPQRANSLIHGWRFHVVLYAGGRILDFDYGRSNRSIDCAEYFAKMFSQNDLRQTRALVMTPQEYSDSIHSFGPLHWAYDVANPGSVNLGDWLSEHAPGLKDKSPPPRERLPTRTGWVYEMLLGFALGDVLELQYSSSPDGENLVLYKVRGRLVERSPWRIVLEKSSGLRAELPILLVNGAELERFVESRERPAAAK